MTIDADTVFTVKDGEWKIQVQGQVLPTIWNSRGAALAGLSVEIRRRVIRELSTEALVMTEILRSEILSDDDIKAAVRPLYSDSIAFEMAWPDMVLPEARAVERAVVEKLAAMGGPVNFVAAQEPR